MVAEVAYEPARAYVHDGAGRRMFELTDAIGERTYRSMQPGRAIYSIPETDELLPKCDPRQGRLLVIESSLYPLPWVGQIVQLTGSPAPGEVRIEARGYEGLLQERLLPTGFSSVGTAGAIFRELFAAVNAENYTAIQPSPNLVAGPPFPDTSFGDATLFNALNQLASQTAHEWWLEYEVSNGVLQASAHFRETRGEDRPDVLLHAGPYGNVSVRQWRVSTEGTSHRLRAVAGARSATEGFSERLRTEARLAAASPIGTAALVSSQTQRHGHVFAKWPTGDGVLTRADSLRVIENVRGQGALTIAAQSLIQHGKSAQNAIDLEVTGDGDVWAKCLPGDVVRIELPPPYFVEGINTVAAIVSTHPMEHLGVLHVVLEVPNS